VKYFISQAEYLRDYVIHFIFKDGNERTVDFKPFLDFNKNNPNYIKYSVVNKFKKFIIHHGDIYWNLRSMDLCFEAKTIYRNDWSRKGVIKQYNNRLKFYLRKGLISSEVYKQYYVKESSENQ